MCGIAGALHPRYAHVIRRMTAVLEHRGPDGVGYYTDGHIALGQRRLSIIDLEGGRQPITNETHTLQLICNGEIYNSPALRKQLIAAGHTFKTATDVEVILHLYEDYGRDCVKHLQGMFAFAIWDGRDQSLFLARDHLGQKPLFFYHDDTTFLFASEAKSILASGLVEPDLNLDALWHYLSLRFMPDQYTLFKGIQKLPAATTLWFKDGRLSSQRYWTIDFRDKLPSRESEIEAELHDLLRETVRMHLLSDVRVGAFLSGGIDSTTIASLMATVSDADDPVPVFSIGVEERGFNEIPYAQMVAERHHLAFHQQVVKANLIDLLPTVVYHMDEPADPYGVGVYLVSQLASQAVKVVLSGDGADESFAGYDRYAGQKLVDYYCLLPPWLRRTVMQKLIDRIPESFGYKSLAQKAAWVQEMSFFTHGERYAQSMGFLRFTQASKAQLFTEHAKRLVGEVDSTEKILTHFNANRADELVDRMLYTDLMTRIPDHNLVIGDRMSMAHSLEVRAPFVDYKLVEYAARIPAQFKLNGQRLKYILRRLGARYLPEQLVHRKKQGFGFPLGMWMRHDLRAFLHRLFSESRFIERGIFHEHYVKQLLDEHLSGKVDHNYRIWILINLEIWHRLYLEHQGVDTLRELMGRMAHGDTSRAAPGSNGRLKPKGQAIATSQHHRSGHWRLSAT